MTRGSRLIRAAICVLSFALAATTAARAQSPAVGSEFQANSFTIGNQYRGDLAADGNGGFVVVWTSRTFSPPAPDGSGFSVFGQRFASDGTTVGSEFQVNSHTLDDQFEPAVAAAANGDFVVVWRDDNGLDGSFAGIFGQRFASGGARLGEEFLVNSFTFTSQIQPDVASASNGDFVVVWASQLDNSVFGISGQRFAGDGMPIGGEFQINTFTPGRQDQPAVAVDATGGFMVVWKSDGQDGDGYGIFGQQFTSSGAPSGNEVQVNSYITGDQDAPDVAAEPGGAFVAVWQSDEQDGDDLGIFGQRFVGGGGFLGDEFLVNSHTADYQYLPAVAGNSNGGFLVVWAAGDIFARRFDSGGNPVGEDFQVSISPYGNDPSVASRPSGQFVAAWDAFDFDGDERAMVGRPGGLIVAVPQAAPAPVLSVWGLLAAALAIFAVGSVSLRRGRKA